MRSLPAPASASKIAGTGPEVSNEFHAVALADLQRRPWFTALGPKERAAAVAQLARRLALFEAPIGQAAAKVSRLAGALADAFEEFRREFPTADAAEAAGRAALAEAGLTQEGEEFTADHFRETPVALAHMLFTLEAFFPSLAHCDPPELLGQEPTSAKG